MTTLSGPASKGEKGKQKFQSLNINNLYTQSRGESLETHQQKNTLPRKHGMQSLGKVPSARRAPANLPSLKLENSGSDAAVSLVPTGGPGWGKQDAPSSTAAAVSPTATATTSPTTVTSVSVSVSAAPTLPTTSSQQPSLSAAALSPAVNVIAKQTVNVMAPPIPTLHHHTAAPLASNSDKSWSAVMSGGDAHPPPYQSAQFQHEFPSLAGGDGAGIVPLKGGGTDTQYGPGPSLRPQTEGSWIQGGSRASSSPADQTPSQATAPALAATMPKGNSGPLQAPPPLLAPAGLQGGVGAGAGTGGVVVAAAAAAATGPHLVSQFRGVVPSFMYRGNFQSNGHGVSNFQALTNPLTGRGRFPTPVGAPPYSEQRQPPRAGPPPDFDEVTPRPIIKEEDLNRMDDMTRDVGWASHDDIDYNQKLAFSDDESPPERDVRKELHKKEPEKGEPAQSESRCTATPVARGWSTPRAGSQPATPQTRGQNSRQGEDEEYWNQQRRQVSETVAIAVELAKIRKEEEEKRFMESKEAAKKKLLELEEKIKQKNGAENKDSEESQGTINPSTIPPQPITPVPIPVPDWEKERENRERERSRTPNESVDSKPQPAQIHREPDFRQLTQIEGRNFINKNSRSAEREISREREVRDRDRGDIRERDVPNFSRLFQSDLPPRFQKQQAERQSGAPSYHKPNNSSSPQPQSTAPSSNVSFAQQYDPRWVQHNSSYSNKNTNNTLSRKNRSDVDSNYDRDRDEDRNRRDRHTPDDLRHRGSDRDRNYQENTRKICSNDNRFYDDYRAYRRENNQEYEIKRGREDDKWEQSRDRHYDDRKDENKKSQIQQDPFDENEMNRGSGDWHREKYAKDWDERTQDRHRDDVGQRPDSRDSRISKESIRDSDYTGNWADSPFEPSFTEEKKKDSYREERRQVPGPITKEKIEADDLKNEKRHLTQLKRSSLNQNIDKIDKKSDEKSEKKMDDAWIMRRKEPQTERNENSSSPKAWADSASPITTAPENSKFMEALEKSNKKTASGEPLHKSESKSDVKKAEKDNVDATKDKEEKHSQSIGSRSRGDSSKSHRSGWSGNYAVYHASNWPKRSGESRGGRSSQRSRRTHSSRDWHATDSDLSGDEISVSTESGKEDRSARHAQSQRSPKPSKRFDKDERNKDLKQDKVSDRKYEKRYEQTRTARENYVPRGEPSRHGRGGFRGPRSITSKRIEGYGIPPSKSPFGNQHEDKEKKLSSDEIGGEVISSDEKTKMNALGLSTTIIGSNRNQNKIDIQNKVARKAEIDKRDRSKGRAHSGSRRQKSKATKSHSSDIGEECWETTSDNSDTENERKDKGRKKSSGRANQGFIQNSMTRQSIVSGGSSNSISNQAHNRSSNQTNRTSSEKRSNSRNESNMRQINTNIRPTSTPKPNKDIATVNKDDIKNDGPLTTDGSNKKENKAERNEPNENIKHDNQNNLDEKNITHFDADGFQEVRSKKNVKERQKIEEKVSARSAPKIEKEISRNTKTKATSPALQLTPQQIANIPPLLGTPVNPPTTLSTNNKSSFERPRTNKLPPRFAKQRENNRLQKAQMQQSICDVNEMNKINQSITMYSIKDNSAPAPMPVANAWDKPITSQLRNNVEQDNLLGMGVENCTEIDHTQQSSTSSQRSSPSNDKMLGKASQVQDKTILDGSTPPVKTIIFENTNYKSTPVNANTDIAVKSKFTSHLKTQQRNEKSRGNKLDETDVDNSMMTSFNKPISDILNKGESKTEPIQMPLSFNKAEDNADMKLDFTFDPDLSQLTEDKGTKSLGLPRSMHAITSAQSTTMSPSTAELNLKIASVKKVWETTMPTVLEHSVGQEDSVTSTASFSASFGPDPGALDHSTAFSKGTDTPDDNHEGYSPSPNQSCTSNNTTNVCKVKPTQQLAGAGQAVHAVSAHHGASQQHTAGAGAGAGQHSAMVGQNLISHPLSPPPPIQQMLGASVGLGQPPQQYTSNQHINYQPSLGGNAQYGSISAIPSPPTVLYNSTQQMPTQGGLYGPFQIDQSQVLNTQGRSQFSQYPNPYGLGQTASSPYSAQSMYLQTAPPHPPPSAQPPPDIYQSLSSQYRMAATGPFGQSQQLANNPSTVLISSTSNSLMSATVKPSSQQISAIGTKAGAVGQAYQQQSQQGQQLYIPYDPTLQANYLSNAGVLQRGPTGPVQNSVVPGLQPSSSYYSGSGAQTGFYQQPGNSTMQSAQLHQTSFGLQGSVFGTHNQSHASAASLQSFGSQFLSSPMQMAAAALTAQQQQYRSPNLPNPNYMKGVSTQHITDQSGRSQQLKSPGANQDVLASVFNSAPQISSPKSRQNCKQPPPQSSPTQHKYVSAYPTVNTQQSAQIPPTRYPAPIQRPVNFQPSLNSSLQGSGSVASQRHRPTHNQNSRNSQRQYYGAQGSGIPSSQSDKSDDSKLNENGPSVTISSVSNSSIISSNNGVNKTSGSSTTQGSELTKDTVNKDEAIVKE